MRVVLSVGGSVLAPDLDVDRVEQYAAVVGRLVDEGHEVGIVVGGGTVAREYIGAARDLSANEVELDRFGIGVTRLNARLLGVAIDGRPTKPALDYEEATAALDRDGVVVMGGVAPGQTTDAVAAALAEDASADLLVFATSVDGVYTADPETDPDATRHDVLSPAALVEVVTSMSRDAGASAPVDLVAAKLIQRAGLDARVIDGTDPGAVAAAVLDDEYGGTAVVADGEVTNEEVTTLAAENGDQ